MIDPDELRRLLVSEKITHRKKGRVECENKLFRDRLSIACNPSLTMSLLHAATECEITEINLSQSKGKVVELDLSVFFRNMVKYCTSYGQVKSHKTGFVFEHIIDILCNEDLPVAFKGNHKQALGLLLQPSMVHSIPFERSMKMSIIYLKEILIDFASLKDPLNHKLLRATCMCMFQEESCQLSFVSNVLSWFVKLLQQTSEDSTTHALVAATVAECCASFMRFQHLNVYSALSKELEFVFQVVVKYLSSFQYREMHKDAYFAFIDAYLALCTEYFHLAPPVDSVDSIRASSSALEQLSEYLLSEAHLKSLVISMRTHPSSSTANKDNTYVLLQDVLGEENSKWNAQFVIIVSLLHRLGAGRSTTTDSSTNGVDSKPAQTPRNKTNRDEGQTVTANKRMRVDGISHTSIPSSNSSNVLATSVPAQRALHTPYKSNSFRASPTPTTTNFNLLERISTIQLDTSNTAASFATPGVRNSSTVSSAQSNKQNAALVLESYLVVLLVGLRQFPDGSFISAGDENTSSAENSIMVLQSVHKYTVVLKHTLCDVLHYACETQLLGTLLLVLTELRKLANLYANTLPVDTENHNNSVWMEILTTLLTHPKCTALHSTTSAVRKDTLYAYMLQLVHCIAGTGNITHSTLTNGSQLWQYSFLHNPLLIETSVGFDFIASLSKCDSSEIPVAVVNALHQTLQTMGHTELLAILSSKDYNTSTFTTTTTTTSSSSTDTVHSNIRSVYGVVTLLSWLYAQLAPLQVQQPDSTDNAHTSNNRSGIQFIASSSCLTRVPVSMLNNYGDSIISLVSTVLHSQCRKRITLTVESVAKIVAVRSNNLHWLDHFLDTCSPTSMSVTDTDATEARVDSACNESQLQVSAALLHTLATQLLSIVASNSLRNEASEQFNAWQSVILLTISAYAALIDTATTLSNTTAGTSQQTTIDFVTTQLTTVLTLIKSCVSYVEKKLIALKLTHVSEYFDTLSSALVLLQPALSVYGNNNAELARLRTQCGHGLVKCVRAVQTIVLSKANKSASNDHFNTQHQPSHAIDIDDEFLEHGTSHSSTNRAYIDVDEDMNVSDNGSSNSSSSSRQVMVFSTEQLACYAAIARCVVALQESCSNTCGKRILTNNSNTLVNNATTNTLNAIEEGMQKSIDFLFTTQSLNDSVSLLMDAECKLLIAQCLVVASPSGAATMCIITKCAWHLEYGVLGYCKVLQIILQLLSNDVFWCASERSVDLTLDTVLNSMLDYVLPQDNEVLEQYLQNMWQCRYLQLLCVARIMHYCDVTSVKSCISPLFVNAFADVNVTVRLCAAQYVHLLLPLFKNTQNVYVSLLQGSGVALVYNHTSTGANTAEEEVLEVVALIRGIETMASVEPSSGAVQSSGATNTTQLLRQALLDLFKLCCSRSSLPSTTNPANANPNSTTTDYHKLLNSAMQSLARKLHYAAPTMLIQEHLRYLIHEWLLLGLTEFNKENASLSQLSSGSQHASNKNSRGKVSTLTLADFPYYLLSPESGSKASSIATASATTATSAGTNASNSNNPNHLLQSFLRTYSAIIVPIICQLDNTRYRWACILQYAQLAGYNNSDRDIAVIVKRNIRALTALQYTLQCAGQLRTSFGNDAQLLEEQQCDEYSTVSEKAHFVAQNIHSLVTRSSSEAELSVYINSKISDTVCEVVLLQLNDALNEVESCGDGSIASISKLLIDTLTMVGAGNNINSLSELFGLCNILDLLAQLHYRLLETRRQSTAIAVLATLQVLVGHHAMPIQRSTLTAILHVVHCTVCMFPSLVLEAVQTIELFTKLVEKFVRTVEDAHKHLVVDLNASSSANSASGSVQSTDHSTEEVLSFVPELLAESVLLLKYIAVLLQSSREEGAHAALLVLINSNKLDRQAAESDKFTSTYFSSDSLIQGSSNRMLTVPYTILQRAATSINNSIARILHHVSKTYNNTILAPLLPLPSAYFNTCFRKETQVYQKEMQTNTVKQRIRTLIEVIQRRIDGELVSLSYIWLQLKIITQLVIPDITNNVTSSVITTKGTLTNGRTIIDSVSWERDVDLLSTFLSALIGLCKHCDENTITTTTSDIHALDTKGTTTGTTSPPLTHSTSPLQQSLHHSILTLIGHFGAPDLLSLNHTKFPIQAGNIIKNSVFEPESIKLRLLLRVFSMLFTTSQQSRVSHSVLRELSCSGYFATLQTTSGHTSGCCEVLCNELVASYSHSVIAREKNALNGPNNSRNGEKNSSFVSCWDESLWRTDNKSSYDMWLCELTYALVEECFIETAPKAVTPVNAEHPVIPTIDMFISLIRPIVRIRSDIAEVVFPLVVHFILKTNGVNSYAHNTLSNYITTHLLSVQCHFAQATQLGCNLLTYLMRQDVTDFLAQCTRTSITAAKSESSKSSSVEWSLPFCCILDVDFSYAAKAATRCNLVCTALLFAELSDEDDRHSSEHQRRLHSSSINNNSNVGGSAVVFKPGLHSLLMPIYQGIHDADAIYGIDLCSSLELQALLFSRKGKWMEALCTYEGIIQSRSSRAASGTSHSMYNNNAMTMAENGIATALGGLGAQFTLARYNGNNSSHVGNERYGNSLSQWHPSMQDLASHSGSPSADANSFFADIHSTRARAASPTLLTTSADTRSTNITSILQDMQRSTRAAALRVAQSSTVLFSDILRRMGDETAVNVLRDVAHAQQLTEICEVCDVLSNSVTGASVTAAASGSSNTATNSSHSSTSQHTSTAVLLSRWQARQSHHNTSASAPTESPFALRATLLQRLISAGRTTAYDAMQCLSRGEVGNSSRSANIAHAVTPQVYKFWNDMSEHIATQRGAGRSVHYSDTLLTANLAYFECRLLWAKGLKDASIANINYKVIAKLKGLLQDMQTAKSASTSRALGAAPSASSGRSKASASNTTAQQEQSEAEAAEYFEELLTESRTRNLLSEALCTGGEWVSTKRAATGTEILDEYLDPAVQFATGTKELIRAYTTLASFHARLHQNLKAKVQSAEWLQGARVLADRCTEFEECRQLQEQLRREMNNTHRASNAGDAATANGIDPRTLYRHVATLKKEIELDSKEREAVEESVNRYLVAAVTDFAKVLELSKEADVDCVFRLVQLWLSNHNNPQINALMDDIITSVPSYKFAPLSYQILSRLGGISDEQSSPNSAHSQARLAEKLREPAVKSGLSRTTTACSTFSGADSNSLDEENEASFQLALCRMVLKLCNEHPHHILPQLFALAHEREFSDESAVHVKKNLSLSRLETATMLVNQLQANPAGRELVVSTRTMLLAYIDLANASTAALQKVGRTKGIKFKEVQARGKRFNEVMGALSLAPAVITLSLPLSPINDYTNIVRIEGFQQTFSITDNGISRPKIITCQGTDGKAYVQLVKGGDDMRQDAVMQQVFANVNYTLSQDEETQKRNLAIRTYKIIPTTPQTGILEWVQNTQAFGTLLCDRDHGAHNRYYPTDWSHGQCREHLKDATDNADKLKRYQDVCSRFHPAFRFFFLEKYADPVQWVASRLAYARSVASNSIIGYILGIGDRHAHNILLDTVTGEVVHIDFGIVFEQGKGLGTPETVPFRLTRDVVDGMGVTACEGTFRRSCEEVLRVLRDNSLQIMTILEVVIHDPLYKWSLSPLQARMKQNLLPDYHTDLAAAKNSRTSRGSGNGNGQTVQQTLGATAATKGGGNFGKDAAERTLRRVLHKLQGQEDPSSGEALSIEGQVDLLLNEARSPHNLSKLFPGWAPWL